MDLWHIELLRRVDFSVSKQCYIYRIFSLVNSNENYEVLLIEFKDFKTKSKQTEVKTTCQIVYDNNTKENNPPREPVLLPMCRYLMINIKPFHQI